MMRTTLSWSQPLYLAGPAHINQVIQESYWPLMAPITTLPAVPVKQKKRSLLHIALGIALSGAIAGYCVQHGLHATSSTRLLKTLALPPAVHFSPHLITEANATPMMSSEVPATVSTINTNTNQLVPQHALILDKNLEFSDAHGLTMASVATTKSVSAPAKIHLAQADTHAASPTTMTDAINQVVVSPLVNSNSEQNLPDAQPDASLTPTVQLAARKQDKPAFSKQISPDQQALSDYHQAISKLQQGRVSEAQNLLAKSLASNPANQEVRMTLVGLLVDNKRPEEAIAVLRTGLEIHPQQTDFAQALARLLVNAGQSDEAINTLQAALPYAPQDGQYHGFFAVLLQREGKHNEAIEHYQLALRGSGNSTAWLVGLGVSLQAEGRLAEAQTAFTKARSAQLDDTMAQFVDQRIKQLQQQLN